MGYSEEGGPPGAHGTKMRCAKPKELQAKALAVLNSIQIVTGHFYINKM